MFLEEPKARVIKRVAAFMYGNCVRVSYAWSVIMRVTGCIGAMSKRGLTHGTTRGIGIRIRRTRKGTFM